MIADKHTNTIYFSELIETDSRYSIAFKRISNVLNSFGIKGKLLPKTKDIWARDYMPIQVSGNKFIEYKYDPDYLQGSTKGYRDLKTYSDIVCDQLSLKTQKSDIILDGGNFVKSSYCVILTDKIVKENRLSYSKSELTKLLIQTFEVEKVILIPWDSKNEIYGHSDGMVRFIDDKTVLVSYVYASDKKLISCLERHGLTCELMHFKSQRPDKRSWAYINFLQTKDLILQPKFNIPEDYDAFNQLMKCYPNYSKRERIEQVDIQEIVRGGGALNCITWTTKE